MSKSISTGDSKSDASERTLTSTRKHQLHVRLDKTWNSLYFDEQYVANRIKKCISKTIPSDFARVKKWVETYCLNQRISLRACLESAF